MRSVFYTFTLISAGIQQVYSTTCNFTSKGTSTTIHGVFEHTLQEYLKVAWLIDNKILSTCSVDENCTDMGEIQSETVLRDLGYGRFDCVITLYDLEGKKSTNVTLIYLREAGLKHEDPLYTCDLGIFFKVEPHQTKDESQWLVLLAALPVVLVITGLLYLFCRYGDFARKIFWKLLLSIEKRNYKDARVIIPTNYNIILSPSVNYDKSNAVL